MSAAGSTYWTIIEAAAMGSENDRSQFAETYLPIVRAYLRSHWKGSCCIGSVDDAAQDVFLECFREHGPLSRVDRERCSSFRAFLFGITRNVARRIETARFKEPDQPQAPSAVWGSVPSEDPTASVHFDREWAKVMMARAAALQRSRAKSRGNDAIQRVELLRLRFQEGLAIREIAAMWGADSAKLHHEYAKARSEFQAALIDVLRQHGAGSLADAETECRLMLEILK